MKQTARRGSNHSVPDSPANLARWKALDPQCWRMWWWHKSFLVRLPSRVQSSTKHPMLRLILIWNVNILGGTVENGCPPSNKTHCSSHCRNGRFLFTFPYRLKKGFPFGSDGWIDLNTTTIVRGGKGRFSDKTHDTPTSWFMPILLRRPQQAFPIRHWVKCWLPKVWKLRVTLMSHMLLRHRSRRI